MWKHLRLLAILMMAGSLTASAASMQAAVDCSQDIDIDRALRGCAQIVDDRSVSAKSRAEASHNRGLIYYKIKEYDKSISDFDRALKLQPDYYDAYVSRGTAYEEGKGDHDRAIADYDRAIRLQSYQATPYYNRGLAHSRKNNYSQAIADFSQALRLKPDYAAAYNYRGLVHRYNKNYDEAITDFDQAIRLKPDASWAFSNRGDTHSLRNDYDRAIADYDQAIRIDPALAAAFTNRGQAREKLGQRDQAIADYRAALAVPARYESGEWAQKTARERLIALTTESLAPIQSPDTLAPIQATSVGRRIALVIGNSAYQGVGRLANPANDGRAIAVSLRRLGFAEVVERYDLGVVAMGVALKDFGDRTGNADWAVVYYAGHGMEMNGISYLIPVDAKLEKDTHVADETIALSRVLEKVENARKLRLVILDACRNNPFVARMVRTGGALRSIGRGLAQVEPEGGVLVAYAAKHGSTAEDGPGANSPFAEALLAHMEDPGLEINFLFRKVRDRVLANTGRRQEPFLYGSLPSESLFFKQAEAR
jgi:tetratricopeptide (TPR) repeat protein